MRALSGFSSGLMSGTAGNAKAVGLQPQRSCSMKIQLGAAQIKAPGCLIADKRSSGIPCAFLSSPSLRLAHPRTAAAAASAGAAGQPAPQNPGTPPQEAAAAAAPAQASAASPTKPAKVSKARLPSLDSLRFFLIAYIAVGHFVGFATRDAFLLRLLSQVNVWVGAFFVISGYVAGYTATEVGKFEASPRVKPAWAYTVARVAGFYPLFLLVQLIFAPMFIYADNFYNGPLATAAHFLMSATLSQAWFPAHAEVWNAPTWFLSALTFAMLVLPHVLPSIAAMRKRGLKKLLVALVGLSVLGKLAYSYDLGAWWILEGMATARSHPNILFWNLTRFHPFYALLEVLMGVAACRLVMLDGVDDEGKPLDSPPQPGGSVLLPALGLLGITVARAAGWITLNDPLTRCLLFLPLFIAMIMRMHRNTLAGAKGMTAVLSHPFLTYLGTISFPIFILHGALGQLFYKKIIATKVWGAVQPLSFFPLYCAAVILSAAVLQKVFLENKKVQEISGSISKAISGSL